MRRETRLACAEDRVVPMMAVTGGTTCAGHALVARPMDIAEVGAAGTLQQVAADRRHIPKLRRCAGQDRVRKEWITFPDQRIEGNRAVSRHRSDAHSAAGSLADFV